MKLEFFAASMDQAIKGFPHKNLIFLLGNLFEPLLAVINAFTGLLHIVNQF